MSTPWNVEGIADVDIVLVVSVELVDRFLVWREASRSLGDCRRRFDVERKDLNPLFGSRSKTRILHRFTYNMKLSFNRRTV
jgi:hypothetical protein